MTGDQRVVPYFIARTGVAHVNVPTDVEPAFPPPLFPFYFSSAWPPLVRPSCKSAAMLPVVRASTKERSFPDLAPT